MSRRKPEKTRIARRKLLTGGVVLAGVPAIDPDQHRLILHGLVKRPLIFTMDDIVRFPSESHIYFLECSGNSFWTGNTPQSTVQHTHGEMSCCDRTGWRC